MVPEPPLPTKGEFLGCLLGAFVGDASGATLEFYGSPITREIADQAMTLPGGGVLNVGPGQVTDDSEMAMALANGLWGGGGSTDAVAAAYVRWLHSRPFDIGTTTINALRDFTLNEYELARKMMEASRRRNMRCKSNGGLMRCTPIPVYGVQKGLHHDQIAEMAMQDAMLTHPNQTCQLANGAYSVTIASLLSHPKDEQRALLQARTWCERNARESEVREWLQEATTLSATYQEADQQIGFVKHGFILAFMHLAHKTPYYQAIRDTLMLGGDTDTNAAIVGGMMGAFWGVDGIPHELREKVLNYTYRPGDGRGHRRPEWLHPRLVLEWV